MFRGCTNLVESSWNIPSGSCIYNYMARGIYEGCVNLESPITDLLPKSGFHDRIVCLNNSFKNCGKMTGTVPSNILWDDTSKIWESTGCFSGCTALENYSSIPSAWGGGAV